MRRQREIPRVLLLTSSTSYRSGDFLAAARRLGLCVTLASDRLPALPEPGAGELLQVDLQQPGEGLSQILEHARVHPVDAVVGTGDDVSKLAASAARALGCVHASLAAVEQAADKHRFRQRMARSGLPTPQFRLLSLSCDLPAAAAAASYPCVLKPLHLGGSRGVIRADDATGFVHAARRIHRLLDSLAALTSRRQRESLLVEAFIPGQEVALEGLLIAGRLKLLALFDKPDPLHGPFFEETLFVTPSRHCVATQARVIDQVQRAAAALGLAHGPVHAELRVDGESVTLLELAPRSIGGLCARSLRFAPGMSEEELILRQALGWPVHNFSRETRASGVMMIPIPGAGILRGVDGVDAARQVSGIDDVVIAMGVGELLVPLPEGDRYLGFLFASANEAQEVEMALRRAHERLRVRVRR